MSVIINEFEIVMDEQTEAPKASAETRPEQMAPPPPPSPADIRDLLQHQAQRIIRILAH